MSRVVGGWLREKEKRKRKRSDRLGDHRWSSRSFAAAAARAACHFFERVVESVTLGVIDSPSSACACASAIVSQPLLNLLT